MGLAIVPESMSGYWIAPDSESRRKGAVIHLVVYVEVENNAAEQAEQKNTDAEQSVTAEGAQAPAGKVDTVQPTAKDASAAPANGAQANGAPRQSARPKAEGAGQKRANGAPSEQAPLVIEREDVTVCIKNEKGQLLLVEDATSINDRASVKLFPRSRRGLKLFFSTNHAVKQEVKEQAHTFVLSVRSASVEVTCKTNDMLCRLEEPEGAAKGQGSTSAAA